MGVRSGKHEVPIYLPFNFAVGILATTVAKISLVSERDFSSLSFMDWFHTNVNPINSLIRFLFNNSELVSKIGW